MTPTGTAAATPYLRVEGLAKRFPGDVHELAAENGISFSVPRGKLFTLLGPSGCGKSTTLRCIAGLERPERGSIVVNGRAHVDTDAKIFVSPDKRGIGMVFQSYAIWPHMTVYDNVAYALEVKKTPRSEIRPCWSSWRGASRAWRIDLCPSLLRGRETVRADRRWRPDDEAIRAQSAISDKTL